MLLIMLISPLLTTAAGSLLLLGIGKGGGLVSFYAAVVVLLGEPLAEGILLLRSASSVQVEIGEKIASDLLHRLGRLSGMKLGVILMAIAMILLVVIPEDAAIVSSSTASANAYAVSIFYVGGLLLIVMPFMIWSPKHWFLLRVNLSGVVDETVNVRTALKDAVEAFSSSLWALRGSRISNAAIVRLELIPRNDIRGLALKLQYAAKKEDSESFVSTIASATALNPNQVLERMTWQDYADQVAKLTPFVVAVVAFVVVLIEFPHYIPSVG